MPVHLRTTHNYKRPTNAQRADEMSLLSLAESLARGSLVLLAHLPATRVQKKKKENKIKKGEKKKEERKYHASGV